MAGSLRKMYKYRALQPFEYAADIIVNKRFHAAYYHELNDPAEGDYVYDPRPTLFPGKRTKEDQRKAISNGLKRWRICSFSMDWRNPTLWAYYADGFKGICVEVEVERQYVAPFIWRRSRSRIVYEVQYSRGKTRISNAADSLHILPVGVRTLVRKGKEWEPEKEVRIVTTCRYIPAEDDLRITRVFLGPRTPSVLRTIIRQITPADVSVWETHINGTENVIEVGSEIPLTSPPRSSAT
ncbi:MAG TPA: DUF2971 domain-containing protein [Sedimentisphaerales bacterium]|nr:DUF2971 domain-containing protein [Sedimentisphaerales bacterium]